MFRLALALILLVGGVFYLLASFIPFFNSDAIPFILIGMIFLTVGVALLIHWVKEYRRENLRLLLAKDALVYQGVIMDFMTQQRKEIDIPEVVEDANPSPLRYWEIARWLSTNAGGGDSRKSLVALGLNIAGRTKDGKHYLVICPLGWREEKRGYITHFIDESGNTRIRQYNGVWPVIDIVRRQH